MTPIDERRLRHAPKTAAEILAAARDLSARGFGDYTVAHVLSLDVIEVRRMIGRLSNVASCGTANGEGCL